jgi:hypothetical protein
MFEILFALFWTFILLISFNGWGILVNYLILRNNQFSLAVRTVIGKALLMVLGGWFNLLSNYTMKSNSWAIKCSAEIS